MIDSNNQLKTLSKSLINAVRDVMEAKKTNKHGHDAVGHEDPDIDNDGDTDKSDAYLHNRRKAIAKSMKKEEVEAIDELSSNTLKSYRTKARADAFDAADVDDEPRFRKRASGSNTAGKKLVKRGESLRSEEAEKINELSQDKLMQYRSAARKQGTGIQDKMKIGGGDWSKDGKDTSTLKKRMSGYQMAGRKVNPGLSANAGKAPRVAATEGFQIDEALDAAARYGHHHVAIKELMKSIDQHVKNHKDDALKHRDYRGKKGVNWSHVGDLAQVHSQLADIHDRLAMQGEYKKSMNEEVELTVEDIEQIDELSKSTMGSYVKKAADDFSARKPKMGYDGQLKKMQNRKVGVNRALDKMYGEAKVDGVAPGSMDNDGHLCATKVFHKEWAEGTPIFSQHAEPDANGDIAWYDVCLLYTSPSPRDRQKSRMPSSA